MNIFARIVALFETNAPHTPLRGRISGAALMLLGIALWPFWMALSEPSLGLRWQRIDRNTLELSATHDVRSLALGQQHVLKVPSALVSAEGGAPVLITPHTLLETSGIETYYKKQAEFHAQHLALWQILQSPRVLVSINDKQLLLTPTRKAIDELGARFWWPWVVGCLSLLVALVVWVFSANRRIATLYLLAALSYSYVMGLLAGSSSRLLTQPPLWNFATQLAHVAGFVLISCLCLILWHHPQKLGSPRRSNLFAAALLAWATVWLSIDLLSWVDTISFGFRLPISVLGLVCITLLRLQWLRSKELPLERSQLKWLILLFSASFGAIFLAYVYAIQPDVQINIPQAYGFSWIAFMFLGLIPLATRLKMFALEAWWTQVWVWLLGGLLVVLLDVVLLRLLHLSSSQALLISVALAGWLYFPLRQWLWQKFAGSSPLTAQDYLPQIVELISQTPDAASLQQRWLALWESALSPRSIAINADSQIAHVAPAPIAVKDLGRQLYIPALGVLPALNLHLAQRGARLFNNNDTRLVQSLYTLAEKSLLSQQAFARGAELERQRIAADLHDDLGARLLSLTREQASPNETAELARLALQDMRLSVRGLSGTAKLLHEVAADWRAETVERLDAAHIAVEWEAHEIAPAQIISARYQMQLTRVVRESISNVIRHSQARVCRVAVRCSEKMLHLGIEDDGQGFAPDQAQGLGHGLAGMERRVRSLQGQLTVVSGARSGVKLFVQVPLHEEYV